MDRITVARVGKTHGVKGYLKLLSFSGDYEHLSGIREGSVVFKNGKSKNVKVTEITAFGDKALIKFFGYDNPEDAREFTGGELWVEKTYAAPLNEGEYYISDLIGCVLFFEGETVGEVIGVAEIGHSDLLEVKTTDKGFRYVPLKDEYVGNVSIEKKTIEIKVRWIVE